MASPFVGNMTLPDAPRPAAGGAARTAPVGADALHRRLMQEAATATDKGQFFQQHKAELAQLAPAARNVVLNAAGRGIPSSDVTASLDKSHGFNAIAGRTLGQLKDMGVNAIPGAIHLAGDAASALPHLGGATTPAGAAKAGEHPAVRRLVGDVNAVGRQTAEDFAHPGRNPGYLIADLFGLSSLGAGALERGAAAAGAVKAGEGAGGAVRALATKPPPKSFPLTVRTDAGQVTLDKLMSQNPLWRKLIQEPRNRGLQSRLNAPGRIEEMSPVGRRVSNLVGPERTVSRVLRAQQRTQNAVDLAPADTLQSLVGRPLKENPSLIERDKLPKAVRAGLTRAQLAAIRPVSVFGDEALANPAEASRLIREHHADLASQATAAAHELEQQIPAVEQALHDAETSGDPETAMQLHTQLEQLQTEHRKQIGLASRNETVVADTHLAEPALNELAQEGLNGSSRFARAAKFTKLNSDLRTQVYHEAGLLEPESISYRERAPAQVYRAADAARQLRAQGQHAEAETILRGHGLLEDVQHGYQRAEAGPTGQDAAAARAIELQKQPVPSGTVPGAIHSPNASARAVELNAAIHHATQERDLLQRHFDASAQRTRPRTAEEAQQRLDEIQQILGGVFEGYYHYHYPTTLRLEAFHQNRRAGKLRRRGLPAPKSPKEKYLAAISRQFDKEMRDKALAGDREARGYLQLEARAHELEQALREYHGNGDLPAVDADIEAAFGPHAGPPVEGPPLAPPLEKAAAVRKRQAEAQQRFGTAPVGPDEQTGTRLSALNELVGKLEAERDVMLRHNPSQEVRYKADILQQEIDQALTDAGAVDVVPRMVEQRRELPEVPGAFRTPEAPPQTSGAVSQASVPATATKFGKGPPQARDTTLTHSYKAGNIQVGNVTADVASATRADYVKAVKLVNNIAYYKKLWRMSTPTRANEYQIPIRDVRNMPREARAMFDQSDQGLPITREELDRLTDHDVLAMQQYLHPEEFMDGPGLPLRDRKVNAPLGSDLTQLGIRWVDRRYLSDLSDLAPRGALQKAADVINNPMRFLSIYARGAYILNLPGNLGMQVLTQGWMAPEMYARAWNLRGAYGERTARTLEGMVGEGKARSFSVPTGPGHDVNEAVGRFWSSFIDRQSRVSSLLYWMHRHGIDLNDPAAVQHFLYSRDDRMVRMRTVVSQLGNKDMVEFNNLTPFERNTLRHLIFVYPWVSRATAWTFRQMIEHPTKTWTIAQLGRTAEEGQTKTWGPLPSYLADRGYMRTASGKLVGTAPLSTYQTATDNGKLLLGLVHDGVNAKFGDALTPAMALVTGSAEPSTTPVKQRGALGHLPGFLGNAVAQGLAGLPQYAALKRGALGHGVASALGGIPDTGAPLAKQPVFQTVSPSEGLGPLGAGQMYPREATQPVVDARVQEERLQALPAPQRAYARARILADSWVTEARRVGVLPQGELDPLLQQAIDTRAKRMAAYAQAAKDQGVPENRLTERPRFQVDLDLAVNLKLISRVDAGLLKQQAKTMSDAELDAMRRDFVRELLGGGLLSEFKSAVKGSGGAVK